LVVGAVCQEIQGSGDLASHLQSISISIVANEESYVAGGVNQLSIIVGRMGNSLAHAERERILTGE
jgi:hypothetical protein